MTPLEITRVDRQRYRLSGELDMATAPKLEEAMDPVARVNRGLVLELEDVTFIDSYGLRALVQLSTRLNGSGPLVLAKVPDAVQRVLDIVGMQTLPGIQVRDDG